MHYAVLATGDGCPELENHPTKQMCILQPARRQNSAPREYPYQLQRSQNSLAYTKASLPFFAFSFSRNPSGGE